MPEAGSAKNEILARIRRNIGDAGETQRALDWGAIQRSFRKTGLLSSEERIDLFSDRLRDYGAGVHYASRDRVRDVLSQVLAGRGKKTIVVPKPWPEEWMPLGVKISHDEGLTYQALDQSEGVMTACTLAIALTGTIILRGSPLESRRALTLIPDYHLCIIQAEQVVELVPEAIERLHPISSSPLTLISGPSATADIEMMRVQGVHGPRTLDVIIVQ